MKFTTTTQVIRIVRRVHMQRAHAWRAPESGHTEKQKQVPLPAMKQVDGSSSTLQSPLLQISKTAADYIQAAISYYTPTILTVFSIILTYWLKTNDGQAKGSTWRRSRSFNHPGYLREARGILHVHVRPLLLPS